MPTWATQSPPCRAHLRASCDAYQQYLLQLRKDLLLAALIDASNKVHVLPCAVARALLLYPLRALLVLDEKLGARIRFCAVLVSGELRVDDLLLLVRHN
jgi:hypothetical protein